MALVVAGADQLDRLRLGELLKHGANKAFGDLDIVTSTQGFEPLKNVRLGKGPGGVALILHSQRNDDHLDSHLSDRPSG